MGIYTNNYVSGYTSHYTEVEPFVGENFNYHELGIMACAEISANHDAFMKSIALSELASLERYGTTDVLYESVNFKGIFEKIKMFFKKIIEKIHKIFHTFIAKMKSWFGGNATFAKTYEKEVIKKWANVKSDWEFKGYQFTNINLNAEGAEEFKIEMSTVYAPDSDLNKILFEEEDLGKFCDNVLKTPDIVDSLDKGKKYLSYIRDHMDDLKDSIRGDIIDGLNKNIFISSKLKTSNSKIDSGEYAEELTKAFRNGETSKESISKDKLLDGYDGSISNMMNYIKDFDKIKSKTESAERKLTKCIDNIIKKIDKSQNEIIKNMKDVDKDTKEQGELVVQASSVVQSVFGFVSEAYTQAFSALLQAQKEACAQAKEIAVKVIGQSKKMTESYDYSDSHDATGFDFISSVKLV